MTHVACESKLCKLLGHPRTGSWVAIGRAVVFVPWVAHALSAGIKCRHCIIFASFTTTDCSVVNRLAAREEEAAEDSNKWVWQTVR